MTLVSDLFVFSWRYQLPALVTLVPAGALGLSMMISWISQRRLAPDPQEPGDDDGQPAR